MSFCRRGDCFVVGSVDVEEKSRTKLHAQRRSTLPCMLSWDKIDRHLRFYSSHPSVFSPLSLIFFFSSEHGYSHPLSLFCLCLAFLIPGDVACVRVCSSCHPYSRRSPRCWVSKLTKKKVSLSLYIYISKKSIQLLRCYFSSSLFSPATACASFSFPYFSWRKKSSFLHKKFTQLSFVCISVSTSSHRMSMSLNFKHSHKRVTLMYVEFHSHEIPVCVHG